MNQPDFAILREFDGVADEVDQYLSQFGLVCHDCVQWAPFDGDFGFLLLGQRSHHPFDFLQKRVGVHVLEVHFDVLAGDLGLERAKKAIDELQEVAADRLNQMKRLLTGHF